jgi:hypothetical protein
MNTHPIFTIYKGSTVQLTLELTLEVDDLDNILFRLFASTSGQDLYKSCLNAQSGYEQTIEKIGDKTVKIEVPAVITEGAETDTYNIGYEVINDDKVYKSKVEKFCKFEEL